MPPKAKFTREEIIDSAIKLIETQGIQALKARSLGKSLKSSSRPIFTVFRNMEEVQSYTIRAVKKIYTQYIDEGLKETPSFKGVGKAYIRFAFERPVLFQLLFMREQSVVPDAENVLVYIDEENKDKILSSIENGYGLNREISEQLYLHLWIYSHGIAVLIATKVCVFSAEKVSEMLTEVFVSMLKKIKTEGKL